LSLQHSYAAIAERRSPVWVAAFDRDWHPLAVRRSNAYIQMAPARGRAGPATGRLHRRERQSRVSFCYVQITKAAEERAERPRGSWSAGRSNRWHWRRSRYGRLGGGGSGGRDVSRSASVDSATDGSGSDGSPDIPPDAPTVPPDASLLPIDATCSANSDCAHGNCVDGVCCNSACRLPCYSCLGSKTQGKDGTCAAAEDLATCGTGSVCVGSNCIACAQGNPCNTANPCQTGTISCTTGVSQCIANGNQQDGTVCAPGPSCSNGSFTAQSKCSQWSVRDPIADGMSIRL